jgi:hypothetical protein
MSILNARLNAQIETRKEKERLQRLFENEVAEHDKKRLINAFHDFIPMLAKKENFKPMVAQTPDMTANNITKVGSLKTWKQNSVGEIYPFDVDFFIFDFMETKTLIMPIDEIKGFSLAYEIYDQNEEYTLLPNVEQRFVSFFTDHLKKRKLGHLIENSMMQVSVFAPPPAVLEDFNILQVFNRGDPYCVENYCFDPKVDDDLAFETWGLDIYYFNNYTKEGGIISEACVEVISRVWIFFELKAELSK